MTPQQKASPLHCQFSDGLSPALPSLSCKTTKQESQKVTLIVLYGWHITFQDRSTPYDYDHEMTTKGIMFSTHSRHESCQVWKLIELSWTAFFLTIDTLLIFSQAITASHIEERLCHIGICVQFLSTWTTFKVKLFYIFHMSHLRNSLVSLHSKVPSLNWWAATERTSWEVYRGNTEVRNVVK